MGWGGYIGIQEAVHVLCRTLRSVMLTLLMPLFSRSRDRPCQAQTATTRRRAAVMTSRGTGRPSAGRHSHLHIPLDVHVGTRRAIRIGHDLDVILLVVLVVVALLVPARHPAVQHIVSLAGLLAAPPGGRRGGAVGSLYLHTGGKRVSRQATGDKSSQDTYSAPASTSHMVERGSLIPYHHTWPPLPCCSP